LFILQIFGKAFVSVYMVINADIPEELTLMIKV
jgi:hypothetical protein